MSSALRTATSGRCMAAIRETFLVFLITLAVGVTSAYLTVFSRRPHQGSSTGIHGRFEERKMSILLRSMTWIGLH